jgi:uncharacterized protein (DUF39 family)
LSDNIEKINKKIKKGKAVVLNAGQIKEENKKSKEKSLKDVDAVTTATSYFLEKWLNQLKK